MKKRVTLGLGAIVVFLMLVIWIGIRNVEKKDITVNNPEVSIVQEDIISVQDKLEREINSVTQSTTKLEVDYYVDDLSKPIKLDNQHKKTSDEIVSQLKISPCIKEFEELSFVKIYEITKFNRIYVLAGNVQGSWPTNILFVYKEQSLELNEIKEEIEFIESEDGLSVFIAAYGWSYMGEGGMDLYHVTANGIKLELGNESRVDMNYENMKYEELKNSRYKEFNLSDEDCLSFVIKGGRLSTSLEDQNGDGFLDIVCEGVYECHLNWKQEDKIIDTEEMKLVYRYNPRKDIYTYWEEESIDPIAVIESLKPYEISPTPTLAPASEQPKLSSKEKERLKTLQDRAISREIVEIQDGDYFDLDADGKLEQIKFYKNEKGDASQQFVLRIGNATYHSYMDEPNYKIYISNMTSNCVDLQVLIDDNGPSGDYNTDIFYYRDGIIYRLGNVGGLAPDIKSLGNGIYESMERASTIQTWYHPRKFYISGLIYRDYDAKDGDYEIFTPKLVRMPKEMYPVGTRVRLNCNIVLYSTQQSEKADIRLKKDQYATLVASDDESWLYIQSDNNITGWLKLNNMDEQQDGSEYYSGGFFSGLCNAD